MKKSELKNVAAIGVIGITNTLGIEILEIEYGIGDAVYYRMNDNIVRRSKINYLKNDASFRTPIGTHRLSEAVRVSL